MTHPLEDCYDKLDRADEHLKTIDSVIKGFLERKPYRTVGKPYYGSLGKGHFVATAQVRERPPKELKLLIGEFCHNLRSSLDNLTYVLATPAAGGGPPDGTEFPIFKDRSWFFATVKKGPRKGDPARGSGLYKIRGMPRGPQTMIKWLQPYRRINDPEGHELWILHQLSIGDKHRRPHLTGAIVEGSTFEVKHLQDVHLDAARWDLMAMVGPFKHGATVGTLTVTTTGPNPEMDVHANLTYGVAFDPEGVTGGAPVVSQLTELRDFVRGEVFPKLEKFV